MSLARISRAQDPAASVMTAAPEASSSDPALPTSERGPGQPAVTSGIDPETAVHVACWSLCEIQRLREENEILRQSAHTFGALAERLYVTLQQHRDESSREHGGLE